MARQLQIPDEVAPKLRERFVEIVARTDRFCDRFLNDEYKDVCRRMAVYLGGEGSPLLRGKAAGWACGLMYAVARVDFLTDPSQSQHVKAEEIAKGFGVSPATMYNRHREIQDGFDLMPLDPEFTIKSRVADNPLVWILNVNGIPTDIRHAPREARVVAWERGLIPYVPADYE